MYQLIYKVRIAIIRAARVEPGYAQRCLAERLDDKRDCYEPDRGLNVDAVERARGGCLWTAPQQVDATRKKDRRGYKLHDAGLASQATGNPLGTVIAILR